MVIHRTGKRGERLPPKTHNQNQSLLQLQLENTSDYGMYIIVFIMVYKVACAC